MYFRPMKNVILFYIFYSELNIISLLDVLHLQQIFMTKNVNVNEPY